MKKTAIILMAGVFVLGYAAAPVVADWNPSDGHKMHFPQLPDPTGWDIEILTAQHECADDWQCSETGPVSDVHYWISWAQDAVDPQIIEAITVTIYDNIPDPDPGNPSTYSQPGTMLWTRTFNPTEFTIAPALGSDWQGFADPQLPFPNGWDTADHQQYQQVNIENIQNPFIQQQGHIYWLGIWLTWNTSHPSVGWKTTDVGFEDVAVYRDLTGAWVPLYDRFVTPDSLPLDFAFVITGEASGAEIPTLTEWGMIVFCVLLFGWMAWVIVRRKRRVTIGA